MTQLQQITTQDKVQVAIASELDRVKAIVGIIDSIHKILKPELDYGVIPGVAKPSLFLPGAQKLKIAFRLQVSYECVDKVLDLQAGFVAYTYKCRVWNDINNLFGEGEGTVNSFEKKYLYQRGVELSPKELIAQQNTISKMAQKRAFVAAVLQATGTSERFTRDVEDMDIQVTSSNESQDIDLALTLVAYGKDLGVALAQDGFKNIAITHKQAQQAGFKVNTQYDKNGKKYVWLAPNSDKLFNYAGVKGYELNSIVDGLKPKQEELPNPAEVEFELEDINVK